MTLTEICTELDAARVAYQACQLWNAAAPLEPQARIERDAEYARRSARYTRACAAYDAEVARMANEPTP